MINCKNYYIFFFLGLFYTNITTDRNCEVRLKLGRLDHETKEEYQLNVKLDTLSGLVNPQKSLTTVKIHIIDVNDNSPEFIFPEARYNTAKLVYHGAIAKDSQFGTNVLTVKVSESVTKSFFFFHLDCIAIFYAFITFFVSFS